MTDTYDWEVRLAYGLRLVHGLASWLAVATAAALGVVMALDSRKYARRWSAALGSGSASPPLPPPSRAFCCRGTSSRSGRSRSVRTSGLWSALRFSRPLRHRGRGGVSPDTIIRWLLIHALVLGPALVGLVVLTWRRHRHAPGGAVQ